MNHAEKCPVCGGSGEVQVPYVKQEGSTAALPTVIPKRCHGCGGSGWVTVQDVPIFWPYPTTEIDDTTTGGAK